MHVLSGLKERGRSYVDGRHSERPKVTCWGGGRDVCARIPAGKSHLVGVHGARDRGSSRCIGCQYRPPYESVDLVGTKAAPVVLVEDDHDGRFGVAQVLDHVLPRCAVLPNVDLGKRHPSCESSHLFVLLD